MATPKPMWGYDTNLNITLSLRRDFIRYIKLKKKADGTEWDMDELFPAGTVITLKFYKNMTDLKNNVEIEGTSTVLTRVDNMLKIRIESTIADTIPAKAEARLIFDTPSGYPNGDNLPWSKTQVVRDD